MTANLPAIPEPLTPPDCDLRAYEFMPLSVLRLRDASIISEISAEGFRAAVLLWCASWHQVPAASLPDDDKQLARFAGYGIMVSAWREVREEALYGFLKCDDGRLYHPIVAEKALESWRLRQFYLARSEKANAKKAAKKVVDPAPTRSGVADLQGAKGTTLKETQGIGPERIGTEDKKGASNEAPVHEPDDEAIEPPPRITKVRQAFNAWNEMAERAGVPKIISLSDTRKKYLKARLEEHGLERWHAMLAKIEGSTHCCGQNRDGWKADFDFAVRPDRFLKILEGGFDDRRPSGGGSAAGRSGSDAHDARVANMLEGAVGALDRRR